MGSPRFIFFWIRVTCFYVWVQAGHKTCCKAEPKYIRLLAHFHRRSCARVYARQKLIKHASAPLKMQTRAHGERARERRGEEKKKRLLINKHSSSTRLCILRFPTPAPRRFNSLMHVADISDVRSDQSTSLVQQHNTESKGQLKGMNKSTRLSCIFFTYLRKKKQQQQPFYQVRN